jgi:hypothetical protein
LDRDARSSACTHAILSCYGLRFIFNGEFHRLLLAIAVVTVSAVGRIASASSTTGRVCYFVSMIVILSQCKAEIRGVQMIVGAALSVTMLAMLSGMDEAHSVDRFRRWRVYSRGLDACATLGPE